MELDKINTAFPRPVRRQSLSDGSSSPGQISSYSTRDPSPDVIINVPCPSLASDIETTPSDNSATNSPSTAGTTTSANAIGTSPGSDFGSTFYHHISQAVSGQREQGKMAFNQGATYDRRTQHTPIATFIPRSRESSNWRASAAETLERTLTSATSSPASTITMDPRHPFPQVPQVPQPAISQYPPFGWTVSPTPMVAFPRATTTGFHGGNTNSGIAASAPRLDLGDQQNQDFYGYGFDRGGGKITLLVPVDMIPPITGIPQTLNDRSGIVMLPTPPGRGPGGLSSNPGPLSFRNAVNPNGAGDRVQQNTANIRRSRPQSQIDSIVASSSSSGAHQKRTKIYCDKWIHEGVCAFTQQGCKFKHEMPMDKATQHDLGLFQGLPNWWKKHQAELQRQQRQEEASDAPICINRGRETSSPGKGTHGERQDIGAALTPPHSSVSASNSNTSSPMTIPNSISIRGGNSGISGARRLDDVHGLSSSRHNEAGAVKPWPRVGELGAQLASPYGPIGSPRKSALDSNTNNTLDINRYSMLSLQDYAGDADDDREVAGLI